MSVPTVVPRLSVEAPTVPTPRGGLLDVAAVVPAPAHLAAGGVDYVTGPCGPARLAPGLCLPNTDIPVDAEKIIDSPEIVEGDPFGVYRRVGCTILGEPYQEMARDSFERGEGYAVERGFYYSVLQHATVIEGGDTPQSSAAAVGALEQVLAENYTGVGTILTNRQGAVVMGANQVAFPGMNAPLTTILGTPIGAMSFSPAGPDGVEAPAGSIWIYATSQVNLWKGEAWVSDPVRDTSTNESTVLVERVWSATTECGVWAALMSLCPCADCLDGDDLPGLPSVTPVIDSPADGATVPAVHDVLGTARPGATIELWHADPVLDENGDETGEWNEYRYTGVSATAQPDGTFSFTGDHAAAVPHLRWRVRTANGVWSDPVEITVEAA